MAGFYIHIPLCRKVCYYCDFHFVASLKYKDVLVKALIREIELRRNEWSEQTFDTIYFGGGTPSVLNVEELQQLFTAIYKNYTVNDGAEVTMEANPDDITIEYLRDLKEHTPVNRLSIGIQSFHDNHLVFMNRRHNSTQARNCITNAKTSGFENITIDLIYGIPGMAVNELISDINNFLKLDIPHLSAYHLSIEPKTVFGVMQKKNKLVAIDEDISREHYLVLTDMMKEAGYRHYEISNFARDNYYSKHNTSYWKGIPYIGIGPSAHSFDGNNRRWNVANNSLYCESLLKTNKTYFEEEFLSENDKFNDYIITSLRTMWGASLDYIAENFGEIYKQHCIRTIEKFNRPGQIIFDYNTFGLTEEGWFIADYIMEKFIYT